MDTKSYTIVNLDKGGCNRREVLVNRKNTKPLGSDEPNVLNVLFEFYFIFMIDLVLDL